MYEGYNQAILDRAQKEAERVEQSVIFETKIRLRLIESNLTLDDLKEMLNISEYELNKVIKGGYSLELESKINEILDSIPQIIKDSDRDLKKFQALLLVKGIQMKDISEKTGLNRAAIYRTIRGESTYRNRTNEGLIEDAIQEKGYFSR